MASGGLERWMGPQGGIWPALTSIQHRIAQPTTRLPHPHPHHPTVLDPIKINLIIGGNGVDLGHCGIDVINVCDGNVILVVLCTVNPTNAPRTESAIITTTAIIVPITILAGLGTR